jgi:tRNA pseudouridine synthase 9
MEETKKRKQSNPPPMSKKKRNQVNNDLPKYYFEGGLRKMEPYDYTYQTYAKQRWIGKTLFQVFEKEFHDRPSDYYKHAILTGKITLNGQKVELDTVVKNSDLIENRIHRHEPPVCDTKIEIVFESEDMLIISKPSSIPVHATGRYRHNTIINILKYENGYEELHPVNRLDRLTSGLMILARNKHKANEMMKALRERQVQKTYYARVRGKFPFDEITCSEPIETVSHKVGINIISKTGKPSITNFSFVSYNGTTSVVRCEPKTGRTHQIRVHLQHLGYPIANDPIYSSSAWETYVSGSGEGVKEVVDQVTQKAFASDVPIDANFTGCIECRDKRQDPIPEQLVIWLHAFKYQSEDWEYETQAPEWAAEEFSGDDILEERFWKYGGLWDGIPPGALLDCQ